MPVLLTREDEFVIVVDSRFDEIPNPIKGLGPWVGSPEG
jgi:hypothetical protein